MSLERYLQDVTVPFPPDTARRIRLDLEEHALAHADALREAGHPDPEAAALASLGPVQEVRRALERAHYTRAEEEELQANRFYRKAEPRNVGQLLLETAVLLALPFVAMLLPGWDEGFAWWSYAIYVAGVLSGKAVDWIIPRHFSARSARVVMSLMRGMLGIFVFAALQLIWQGVTPGFWGGLLGVGLGYGIATLFFFRVLWSCLPKALRNAR